LEIINHTPQLNMRNTVALQGGTFKRIQGSFDVGGRLNQDGTLLWRLDGVRSNRIYVAPSIH
jgi:outer membrane receptor for ferric coprogen and ferric-rhodotorulic acid